MVEGRVTGLVLLINQDRVALRERPALAVLSGQAHPMAFQQKRAEGERLPGRPVDPGAVFDRLATRVENARNGAVDVEAFRHRGDLGTDLLELLDRDAGAPAAWIVGDFGNLHAGPAAVEPIGTIGLVALAGLDLGVEPRAPIGLHLLDFALGYHTLAGELLGIDVERGRMLADRLVHQRLGE